MTTFLYTLLFVCVVGQFVLIKWLQHRHAKRLATTHLAQARAHLVEAAADRQLQDLANIKTGNTANSQKGVSDGLETPHQP